MKKALYAGSFDPITYGHLDVIIRAAKIFDEVIVAIATNISKKSLFTASEKLTLIEQVIKDYNIPNIKVKAHPSGLTVDFAKTEEVDVMIRGIRSIKDMEYEMDVAAMNKTQNSKIETIFFMADKQYRAVSSSIIKEIASFDGDVSDSVPKIVADKMKEKFRQQKG